MREFTLDQLKEICKKSSLPTGDPFIDGRMAVYERLNGGNHRYYATLRDIAAALKPKVTVELGAWQGTSAACFASGNPDGMVYTVDHFSDPGDDKNLVLMEQAEKHYKNLGFYQGWTWDVVEDIKDRIAPIDLLFIDSWHQYEYAVKDWNLFKPLLSDRALVMCDDIIGGHGPAIGGMEDFWDEMPEPKFKEGHIHPGYPIGFLKWQKS